MTPVGLREALSAALATALAFAGCSREQRHESVCSIVRKEVLEKGEDGTPTMLDFELEWDPCPGDQFQVIRGNAEFAACADKYAVGDYVPVLVRHFWDNRGYFRWDIERVGDCERAIEKDSEGSYEKSQECHDVVQYGKTVGFECNRTPFRDLLNRCPWMARK